MDAVDEEVLLLLALLWRRYKRKRRPKRFWVVKIYSLRVDFSEHYNVLQEMRLGDPDSHFQYLRMSKKTFDDLVENLKPYLTRRLYKSTRRPSISPAEKLAITLR